MAKFNIAWPDGTTTSEDAPDCSTVMHYVTQRFGRGAKPEAKVTLAVSPKADVPKKVTK